ncbi:phospholipase D-like domain-containing protein [Halapricum salinum]|uniref:phospholipase D-like domain-containing protein n=1 Tax=Halapricum salinum TaxID=1457250 RepID=UPI000679C956|nr:phospholipase D-like domain-containing protein [Halapricum salinum]
MRRLVAVFVLVTLALTAAAGPSVGQQPDTERNVTGSPVPTITAVYPNPVADGDSGEFVVLSVPNGTDLESYRFGDDEGTVELPNRTASGRVVLATEPEAVPESVAGPILECSGCPELANSGEPLTLRGPNGTLDTAEYADAPEGELFYPGTERRWRPLGATDFEPVVAGPGQVQAFTLPDSPDVPRETLADADERILLAGYTLTDDRVVDALVAARERGVETRVLLDGSPVGGLTKPSADALDRLVAANVSVRLIDGPAARYRFHHPKYAVVDDEAVVLTENWKPAGVGGTSSRGWGVVVDSPRVVDGLVRTFRADSGWKDAIEWAQLRENESFEPASPTVGRYPSRVDPESVRVDRVELLVAPDNAAGRVREILANASDSIRIVQVSIGGRDDVLLVESIEAARRGVEVEILLSNTWYTREENRRLADELRTLADREDIPLSVRLAEPGGRYEKIHAKGVLVDGNTTIVGSLNWNANAYRENREVALVLHGEEAGAYFGGVFERDWEGGITLVPLGLLAVVVLALSLAGMVARRISFDPG